MSGNQAVEEALLFSSSEYNDEELARLMELQRRQTELLRPDIDEVDFDDDDDFSVTAKDRPLRKGPIIPDMRFEKQFEQAVTHLQSEGASKTSIFLSAVIKDHIIIPFISGFAWTFGSFAWQWYRTRGVVNARNPRKSGFFQGVKNSVSEWMKYIFNSVSRNTQLLLNTTTPAIEASLKHD